MQNPRQDIAKSGPRQASALLARTAPGLPVTRKRIVAGIQKLLNYLRLRARKEKARTKKEKVKLERLPLKASEAAPLRRKQR